MKFFAARSENSAQQSARVILQPWHRRVLILLGVSSAIAWLAWKCDRDPAINFLPSDQRAEWILFPSALDSRPHPIAALDGMFRGEIELSAEPKSARLTFRAAKRLELRINGAVVDLPSSENWKDYATADVSRSLRAGRNLIEARVFNDEAPPALWLVLKADQSELRSDKSWKGSFTGSAWRTVAVASVPRRASPGNLVCGRETTLGALPKIWLHWLLFMSVAALASVALNWIWTRTIYHDRDGSKALLTRQFILLGTAAAILWAILFWNNLSLLPFHTGFDSREHLDYIKYIQQRHALPLPNEGFEAFQPPLYYALSAGFLSLFRLNISDDASVLVLRGLSMVFGIANVLFVFLSARLLFPARPREQFVAFLVAAFLPMHLYMSHYVTNETLAATLMIATIYVALMVFQNGRDRVWQYGLLGLCLGAALLTKATALLLIPPLIAALVLKLLQQRAAPFIWIRVFGVTITTALAVCAWHYLRIWQHFGTPLLGNWNPATGFTWWQDPGFHTATDYYRFGAALIDPLFSGFNSFIDGIYSTLWGDGLGGGLSDVLSPTPWNYNLMVAGYLLAVLPTILVLIGFFIATIRFIRTPTPQSLLLIGFAAAVAFGIIFMTLRVPTYSVIKAFFGLSALVPFCWFGAIGWEKLTNRRRLLRLVLTTLLLFWALNSFASFWMTHSAAQRIYAARKFFSQAKNDRGIAEAERAVTTAPASATTHCFLASILDVTDEKGKALEHAMEGVRLDPSAADCRVQLAFDLGRSGDFERALTECLRALELEPENSRAYDIAFSCARELRQVDRALAIGRDALVVSPFDADLHYRVGLAAVEGGSFSVAIPQIGYALLLQPNRSEVAQDLQRAFSFAVRSSNARDQLVGIAAGAPDSPDVRNQLAWIFATNPDPALRNGNEAIRQSERACALTNRSRPDFLLTLAAAEAENGNFSAATGTAQNAWQLAQASSDEKTARLAEDLIATFQANQPYREEPR